MHAISSLAVLLLFCTFCHAQDFGPWSEWTECSQTCAVGVQFRSRTCLRESCMVPQIGQMRSCGVLPKCPIDGGWSVWSRWARCTQTCGSGGTRRRIRLCSNPRPQYNGNDCEGDRVEYRSCGVLPMCPVDGGWGSWSDWSACNARLCRRQGLRYRSRECDNPSPRHGGRQCEGGKTSNERCWRENCPNRNITALNILWLQKGDDTDFSSVSSFDEPEGPAVPAGLDWSSFDSEVQVDCGGSGSSSSDCENAPQVPPAQQTTHAPTTAPTPTPEVVWSNDGDSSSSSSAIPNENLENRPATTKKATTAADDDNGDGSSSSSA